MAVVIHRALGGLLLAGASLWACSMELPKPPPELHYKFNVIPVGMGPSQLLTADLNKDGNDDIVSVNAKDSTLTVLLGKGDGTFAAASTLPVLAEPTSVALGDVNGDGYPDLVANARGAEAVSIVIAKAPGVFHPARRHLGPGHRGHRLGGHAGRNREHAILVQRIESALFPFVGAPATQAHAAFLEANRNLLDNVGGEDVQIAAFGPDEEAGDGTGAAGSQDS